MARELKVEEVKNFTSEDAEFQIRLVKFNGKPHLDARKYWNKSKVPGEKDMKPSSKGIALNEDNFDKFMDIFQENSEMIEDFLRG